MDVIIVRTRLQAIIALELINSGTISKPFKLIKLYQLNTDEDSDSVYHYYRLLEESATYSKNVIQKDGFWRSAYSFLVACYQAKFSGGKLYVAVLNSYLLAIALKLTPNFRIQSFDDGTANTQIRDTSYHSKAPLSGNSFKRKIARMFFPNGSAFYNRTCIDKHYTIYKNDLNVVDSDKLVLVQINWSNYLHEDDKSLIPKKVSNILLGTTLNDLSKNSDVNKIRQLQYLYIDKCELYIPHPRDYYVSINNKIYYYKSPAESIIEYVLNMSNNIITIYHFGTSSVKIFDNDNRLNIINLAKLY